MAEVRRDIIEYAVDGSVHCENGIQSDDEDQDNENRHHELRYLFNALFNTAHNDNSRDADEDEEPDDRFDRHTDIIGKERIVCHGRCLTADKADHIFDDPSADGRIVGQNDRRNDRGKPADPGETAVERTECIDRRFAGLTSDGNLCDHQRKAEGNCKDDVDEQEHTAAVFCCKIREAPDVAETDGRACCGKDKSELTCKGASVLRVHRIILLKK